MRDEGLGGYCLKARARGVGMNQVPAETKGIGLGTRCG